MKRIINHHLSSMLDELLQKALEEKPEYADENTIRYESLFISKKQNRITFPSDIKIAWNEYPLKITTEQKEMIDKIFDKWI